MANNTISINQWEKLLDKQAATLQLFEGEEDSPVIEIKYTLSMDEMIKFVHTVAYGCFVVAGKPEDDKKKLQEFEPHEGDIVCMPEVKDFLARRQILTQYANFRMPKDLDKQYELIFNTPVFHRVIQCINMEQMNDMLRCIDITINNIQQSIQSVGHVLKAGLGSLLTSMDDIKDIDPEAIKQLQSSLTHLVDESSPERVMEASTANEVNSHGMKEVTVK